MPPTSTNRSRVGECGDCVGRAGEENEGANEKLRERRNAPRQNGVWRGEARTHTFPSTSPTGPPTTHVRPTPHTGECPGSVKAGICSCKRSATCGASAETVGGGSRPTRNTETLAQSPTFTQLRRCGVACTLRKSTHNDTCHVISFSITCLSSVRTKDDKKTRDYSSFGCVFTNRSPEFRTITSAINMTNWPFPRRSPRAQLGHDD